MTSGARPKPTVLRILEGNRGKRPIPVGEPIPPPGEEPDPPEYLNDLARAEWERVAPDLYSMGVLTPVDVTMLAAYCMAVARWRQAEADLVNDMLARDDGLDSHGVLIETTNGNVVQNPLVGVANTARRDMLRLAIEFGLTPAARVGLAGKGETEDPVSKKYFGGARA